MSDRTFRTRAELMGDNCDALLRYQAEAEATIEREEVERREVPEHSPGSQTTIMALRSEVAELRGQIADTARTLNSVLNEIVPSICDLVDTTRTKLDSKITERVAELRGELRGSLAVLDPSRDKSSGSFKFASEKADDSNVVHDLASPLGDIH